LANEENVGRLPGVPNALKQSLSVPSAISMTAHCLGERLFSESLDMSCKRAKWRGGKILNFQ